MNKFSLIALCAALVGAPLLLGGCDGQFGNPSGERVDAPLDNEQARRASRGKLTGEDGWDILGGSKDDENSGGSSGIGVNGFLWRASLDTLSFMPIASADPFGGVILTDWYEDPKVPGERYKINVVILDKRLRADGVTVSLFKQKMDKTGWRDQPSSASLARQLEDTILTRARELKVSQSK